MGLYPAIDPLQSSSQILEPAVVGERHVQIMPETKSYLQRYGALQDLIAILGVEELSEEDRTVVAERDVCRSSCRDPFNVAEQYTGIPGCYVPLAETIRGFEEICSGACDHIPEQAFFMSSTLDDALAKAKDVVDTRPSETPAEAQVRKGAAAAAGGAV